MQCESLRRAVVSSTAQEEYGELTMRPLHAPPSPEMGLDLARDALNIRHLPRWDPRNWGHIALEDEPRCGARFRALGLSWGNARARARASADALAAERMPDERDGARELSEDELSLKPQDAIASPSKHAVPARVRAASARVVPTVNFDHQASGGRAEVHDETADHDLPLEADAELSAANCLPQTLFGRRERSAHGGSASSEQLSASEIEFRFFQKSLLVPAKWPGVAPLGAGSVTRARRVVGSLTARGAERAPLGAARPLRRDEDRGEQPSARVQSVTSPEPTAAHPDAEASQVRPRLAGAAPRRVDLPHSRAARAGVTPNVFARDCPRPGACEHEFGEGRAPAGGTAAEDARVGASQEAETYQGYGAKESDYRPDRWKGYRDDYGFTGKEEDIEFGVVYFGKRFYSPGLNRWLSADPLAVHAPGKADLNLYAYTSGRVLMVVDPLGLAGFWSALWESTRNGSFGPASPIGQELSHGDYPRLQDERGLTRLQNKVIAATVGIEAALVTGGAAAEFLGAGTLGSGAVGGVSGGIYTRATDSALAGAPPKQQAKAALANPATIISDAAIGVGAAAAVQVARPIIGKISSGIPAWLSKYMGAEINPSPRVDCVKCTLEYDAMRGGGARPGLEDVPNEYADKNAVEKYLGRSFQWAQSLGEVGDALSSGGPGSRGAVVGYTDDMKSHMFHAEVGEDGAVNYWDPQSGGAADTGNHPSGGKYTSYDYVRTDEH